ncbi:S-layer homology domain-containing protein, partial [Lysinibacillus fusiformis]|nr:S-layer homology domain-containing protein [Lysinibacillus fusiformis]
MQSKKRSYQKFIAATVSSVVTAGAVAPIVPYAMAKENQPQFSDVAEKDYFHKAVSSLAGRGIIKGYEKGLFKPYQAVTRAEAAKMIAMTLNLNTDKVKDPGFKDISKNSWAYGSIAALANQGIIVGYGSQFKPNDPLTRAQLAKILTLAFKLQASPLKDKRFTDVQPADWYANYVQPLIEKGITNGTTATTFSPGQTVTRGQIASFLYRSELAVKATQVQAVITGITNQEIATDKGTYTLSPDLKAWINPSNLSALKGAVLHFNAKDRVIEKVS